MDSEDDIHDANDADTYEDDYNIALYGADGNDAGAYSYYNYNPDDWYEVLPQKNYTILEKDVIRQHQEGFITRFSSALSISTDSGFMDNMLTSEEDKKKDGGYLVGYCNRKIKWCPAPGCDCAIELHHASGGYDVTCSCSYSFCWNCTEESHRPVDCETVSKWKMERSTYSENMKLVLADSKVCPKCKSQIKKNQGGLHMTCNPSCKYEFCWLCLGEWSHHNHSGGFYACNRYYGAYDESLQRYTHYYERWATHESARQKAVADMQQVQTVHLPRLSVKLREPELQLQFVLEAWLWVIECRRVLKWSYVYGYYLPEQQYAKRHFFDYLQGEGEVVLEMLHQCADKEFHAYLDTCQNECDNDFRAKLAGLTNLTQNYFENWVSALENGLSEVDPHGATSMGKGPTVGGGH